jgi:formate dehydrogenase
MASLAREITTPGPGQLRAVIGCSSNVASSGPHSQAIAAALPELSLFVALDVYVTETSRHADYILPATTWLERDGFPVFTQGHSLVPNAQWYSAPVPPRGDARDDWWIIDQIARGIGRVPAALGAARVAGKLGIRPKPETSMDLLVRTGPYGDLFGLRRRGLSRRKLQADGAAVRLEEHCPTGVLKKHLYHGGDRVRFEHPLFAEEMRRLLAASWEDEAHPLRLIGLRELRSQNSWLHNIDKLMVGDRAERLLLHPADGLSCGVADGDRVKLTSPWGSIETTVRFTEDMLEGVAALPHGWAHQGGWSRAVAASGGGYNELTSDDPAVIDRASGNAHLNGIPIRVEPVIAD